MSRGRGRGGFISSVIENLKQDYGKDKEFQVSINLEFSAQIHLAVKPLC